MTECLLPKDLNIEKRVQIGYKIQIQKNMKFGNLEPLSQIRFEILLLTLHELLN